MLFLRNSFSPPTSTSSFLPLQAEFVIVLVVIDGHWHQAHVRSGHWSVFHGTVQTKPIRPSLHRGRLVGALTVEMGHIINAVFKVYPIQCSWWRTKRRRLGDNMNNESPILLVQRESICDLQFHKPQKHIVIIGKWEQRRPTGVIIIITRITIMLIIIIRETEKNINKIKFIFL